LSRALQLRTNFIADTSHELRTPLTVLRANAEVALALDSTCVHADLLEEIVRESEQMTRLVEDLLFLARSDAGSLPLELEWTEIESCLADLVERAKLLDRAYAVEFHTQLAASGFVYIDRLRVEQAVLILVDNAAKYSQPGKRVTLGAQTRGAELIITVTDEGPGSSDEDLPLIFERFYCVDKARTRKQGGTGLGLAIAKSIIEPHSGRIEVESRLN
jgi:two-component system, OmpR family, sensor histidine kinase VicK